MEKNFKLYDYKNKTVKQSEQTAETDFYGAFGWEPADISPAMPGSVTITFRRDRKAEHKAELVRLEKKAEGLRENGAKLKKERTRGASVFGMDVRQLFRAAAGRGDEPHDARDGQPARHDRGDRAGGLPASRSAR